MSEGRQADRGELCIISNRRTLLFVDFSCRRNEISDWLPQRRQGEPTTTVWSAGRLVPSYLGEIIGQGFGCATRNHCAWVRGRNQCVKHGYPGYLEGEYATDGHYMYFLQPNEEKKSFSQMDFTPPNPLALSSHMGGRTGTALCMVCYSDLSNIWFYFVC